MRISYLFILWLAQTALVEAQLGTNAVPFTPASAIAAARSSVKQPEYDRIATNTEAFEAYGLKLMLSLANQMVEKWKLDLPHPLRVNDVVFWLKPKATCIQWVLATRDGRYSWSFDNGWINLFRDDQNSCRVYLVNTNGYELLRRIAHTKSKISEKEAIRIARESLHALGVTEAQLRFHEPPKVERDSFTDQDEGKRYELPLFSVGWSVEGANPDIKLVEMTISGITSNIVEYLNADPNTPRVPLPPDYFDMLGLPANYLDTLPQRTRLLWGLPPLTNSSFSATNFMK